jgi:hypothetical protein
MSQDREITLDLTSDELAMLLACLNLPPKVIKLTPTERASLNSLRKRLIEAGEVQ